MMKLPVRYDRDYHKIYDSNGMVVCFTQWEGSGFDYRAADENGELIVRKLNDESRIEYPPLQMPRQVIQQQSSTQQNIFETGKNLLSGIFKKKEKVRKSYRVRKYIDAKGNIYEVKGSGRVPKGWTVYSGEAEQIKSVG